MRRQRFAPLGVRGRWADQGWQELLRVAFSSTRFVPLELGPVGKGIHCTALQARQSKPWRFYELRSKMLSPSKGFRVKSYRRRSDAQPPAIHSPCPTGGKEKLAAAERGRDQMPGALHLAPTASGSVPVPEE